MNRNFAHERKIQMSTTKLGVLGASIATLLTMLSSQGRAFNKPYMNLPMSFEKNVGQSRAGADFVARGSCYSLFLRTDEAVLALKKQGTSDQERAAAIHMKLVGSRPARAAEENQLPGKVNYFMGNDPTQWRRGMPTFAQVRYPSVYPGIDLIYYGNQGQLEYDFIVNPGADLRTITLVFTGARIDLAKDGNLVLALSGGSVSMHRPYIYQEIDGAKRPIAGGYVKRADGSIGFAVDSYDTARPLVIDPVILYSTYLGGSGMDDAANAIAVDQSGNVYIAGQTTSSNFPTQHTEQSASAGGYDAFVAKIDPSGSTLLYSTYFGGSGDDWGTGIAVDAYGQAFVAGRTKSSNFPTTASAYQTTYAGGDGDAFVAKFNASGSALTYSTYLGGSGYDVATSIALDSTGNAYVGGYNYLAGFPTTQGAYQTTSKGPYDAFITKLNASGSALVYSTYLGGTGDDYVAGIAVDSLGNAYVTGVTISSDFPMQSAPQPTAGGSYDAFVTKFNPVGSALVYSTYLGGTGWDGGAGIAVDFAGNAYVTGQTNSNNFPTTPAAYQTIYGGNGDAFVTKISNSGSIVYSTYLGGSGGDTASAVAVDLSGSALVTGNNLNGGFPVKDALQTNPNTQSFEAFVTKFAPDGSSIVYSTYLGGTGNDLGLGIAVDLLGSAYIAGVTQSTDFASTLGAFQQTNAGGYDGFVVKIAAASVGKITGGGSITVADNIGTFAFVVQRIRTDAPILGDLQYINHATGANVHSVAFSSFSINDTRATFGGTCSNNGVPCTFTVAVTDNGEPGTADTFSIFISGGPVESGTLRSGNIQVH
jgi:hypothetical protein